MFFKIAFRNLLKRKVYASINIFGLAIGLSACLMIYLFVSDELSYDKSYPNAENIYRIARESGQGEEKSYDANSNFQLGLLAKEKLSSIDELTQFSMAIESKIAIEGKLITEKRVHWADNSFFKVFGIEALEGDVTKALLEPNKLVITSEVKEKLFGEQSALGKMIEVDGRVYAVDAVIPPMPKRSHFHFDYLLSLETSKSVYSKEMFEHWGNVWLYTYARVTTGVTKTQIEELVNAMAFEHGPGEALKQFGVKFFAQPVTDIHLHSNLSSELEQNGDFELLSVLISVAILILLIACFNFINLSTARSMWRAKEVGVKKVLGIKKLALMNQFLGESLLLTGLSLVLGLIFISVTLPFFNDFTAKSISMLDVLLSVPILIAIVLVVGVIAGSIPAVMMSSFRPIDVLKGKSSQGDSKFTNGLRQTLVALQFAIAIIMIIGATVIYTQLDFIKNKDLGADISNVLVVNLNNKQTRANIDVLKNKVAQLNTIEKISMASDIPFEKLNSWRVAPVGNANDEQLVNVISTGDNYLKTLDIDWADGGKDQLDENDLLVNEAFVKYFLMTDPVGKEVKIDWMESPLRIAGVIKDFHFESLHNTIRPVMLYKLPSWYSRLVIRVSEEGRENAVADISGIWKEVNSEEELDYFFLEDKFDKMYSSEEKTADMVTYFSIFSVLIACLGLYGLAAFLAESKMKEISIRKVLGATMSQLISIQFRVFGLLITLGSFIGLPIAYYLMDQWLSNFVYRIDVPVWVMPFAVFIVIAFAAISVSYSSVKAALTNPSDNLRLD